LSGERPGEVNGVIRRALGDPREKAGRRAEIVCGDGV
jgi:hypothetical protein